MSKDYHNICNKILQSNKDLYTGPDIIIKEFDCIKKDIKKLQDKIDLIHKLITQINNREDY